MGRRRYDPEATRQAILETARAIFLERGVAETPLSAIAEASGVTKSLIHHHFGSKDALWNAVKVETFQSFFDPLLGIIRRDGDHLEVLREAITYMFHHMAERPELSRLMALMQFEGDQSCMDLELKVSREGLERVRQAQAAGQIRAEVRAESIQAVFLLLTTKWWMFRHIVASWVERAPDDPELNAHYFEDMLRIFTEGILPRT